MNTYPQFNLDDLRLSLTSRFIRLVVGTLLIAIPMIQSNALGTLAVLPLLAIYPVLTAILGFSLVEVLVVSNLSRRERSSRQIKFARTSLFVLGTGLIAYVMGSAAAPAWLALAAIVPILMAILDSDLAGQVLATRRALQVMSKTSATVVHAHPSHIPTHSELFDEHNPKQAA